MYAINKDLCNIIYKKIVSLYVVRLHAEGIISEHKLFWHALGFTLPWEVAKLDAFSLLRVGK